jgi:hypothetical protein
VRSICAFGWVLLTNLLLGMPAYFISWVFAYGFVDSVTPQDHVTFLLMIALFAGLCGLVQVSGPCSADTSARQRAAFGVLSSLSLNATVVGIGSVVSSEHKAEGSVSATFSTTTDVMVAACLCLAALGCALAARRVSPYR